MKAMTPAAVLLAAICLLASGETATAHVAPGNGNYFVSFTDVEHDAPPSSFMLKVQRTYNSRSQFDGLFGYGWGSEYEAYLLPSADGSVVIQESGGGERNRFSPTEFSKADLEKQVERLVDAAAKKEKGTIGSTSAMREKLMKDATARDELSRTLGIFPEPAPGTKLFSTARGDKQSLTVVKLANGIGYLREFADGRREFFNVKTDVVDQGVDPTKQRVLKGVYKVNQVSDPVRKAQLFYEYDPKGHLISVTDKKSQTLRFRFTEKGKVAEVSDKNGNKATYEYCDAAEGYNAGKKCGRGDLVKSRDTAGNLYTYQYDALHNLIRIGSPKNGKSDQEFEEMTYWPTSSTEGQGGIKSVKEPSGVLMEYSYWQDPSDKDSHYKTTIKTTYSSGKAATSSYEFYEKARADGSRYRYKLVSVVDDDKTETIYNECCGQPLQVVNSSGTTKYEYYEGTGLPKERDSAAENVRWEYHPKFHGKITKVVISDKVAKTIKTSEFEYDKEKGQLVKAHTSDGKGILIFYDATGRIASMVDQDKRKITFKYSANSKPSEIIQDGVGSIQVTYDKAGQIKDVKSKGGRQIAISVAAAFQNLLEIIKPAGIQPI